MRFQPDLCEQVPIVGLVGDNFEDLLDDEPMAGTVTTDPAGPALIAFTSGTTSAPKGVVHSHQTLGFETRQLLENYPPDRGRQLTAAPVGHFVGMLGAFLIPVLEGASIDLCDVWDPGNVLKLPGSHTSQRSIEAPSSTGIRNAPSMPTEKCPTGAAVGV